MRRSTLNDIWVGWTRYWFEGEDHRYALGLFRCVIASVAFLTYSLRLMDFDLFYSSQGMFTDEAARGIYDLAYPHWFVWFVNDDLFMWLAHLALVLGFLGLALGLIGRWGTWLVFLLHVMFVQRNPTVVYGTDNVLVFFLFYLSLSQHNHSFHLWSAIRGQSDNGSWDSLSVMSVRLLQWQVIAIYVLSGMEKLKGPQWWEGSAIWTVLGNTQLVFFDLTFMSSLPFVIGILTYATVIFEVYFPFAVHKQAWRPWWLGFGVVFHGMTAALMGLFSFALIMVASYVLFMSRRELQSWPAKLLALAPPTRSRSVRPL